MRGLPTVAHHGLNEHSKTEELLSFKRDPTPQKTRRIKLGNMREIRSELARLYRDVRAGKIDAGTATKLAYLLDLMGRMIERYELEARVEVLERAKRT